LVDLKIVCPPSTPILPSMCVHRGPQSPRRPSMLQHRGSKCADVYNTVNPLFVTFSMDGPKHTWHHASITREKRRKRRKRRKEKEGKRRKEKERKKKRERGKRKEEEEEA